MCELKPCPFCGSENIEIEVLSYQPYANGQRYFIVCSYCTAAHGNDEDKQKAIDNWNMRELKCWCLKQVNQEKP